MDTSVLGTAQRINMTCQDAYQITSVSSRLLLSFASGLTAGSFPPSSVERAAGFDALKRPLSA